MRLIGSLVVLALAAPPAVAQPQECSVDFVRVPDEVRHEIERWLAKETQCSTSIALRVIPTDQGTLYLVAQRPDGRIHEREVPDAAAAGVLVASWVADDWTTAPVVEVPVAPIAPEVTPVIAAPSSVPVAGPRETTSGVIVRAPERRAGRWLGVTPMLHPEGGGGIRADVDLLGGGKWTLGIGAAYISISVGDSSDYMATEMDATRIMAYAARAFELGSGFQLRGSIGLGKVWATGSSYYLLEGRQLNGEATAVQAEVTLLLAHDLSDRWSVLGGPVGTAGLWKDGEDDSFFEQFDLMLMAGARFRL